MSTERVHSGRVWHRPRNGARGEHVLRGGEEPPRSAGHRHPWSPVLPPSLGLHTSPSRSSSDVGMSLRPSTYGYPTFLAPCEGVFCPSPPTRPDT